MAKSRPTQSQMKSLVELMAKDPLLCAGKFSQTFTQKIAKQKWEVIAEQLNALPGAEKSWDKWKKTWQDTRSTTKSKASAIKRHIGGTGGGPSCAIQLNDIQENALSLLSPASVSGHVNSKESNVTFVFDNPESVVLDTDEMCIEEIEVEEANDENNKPSIITVKPDLKRKLSAADRLNESILATTRLGDIAEKKFQMKAAYYEKKIKLMEENNQLLKNLGTAINSLTKNF